MKVDRIIAIALLTALLIVCGASWYYYSTTQSLVAQLSDNQTKLRTNFEALAKEYVKAVQPKAFANEKDLIAWLNSNKGDQSLVGYMTLAKQQGVFMQVWAGWRDSGSSISGVDFSDKWQQVKASTSGVKYALQTVVGKQTYLIDIETKKLIPIEAESVSTTAWGK